MRPDGIGDRPDLAAQDVTRHAAVALLPALADAGDDAEARVEAWAVRRATVSSVSPKYCRRSSAR